MKDNIDSFSSALDFSKWAGENALKKRALDLQELEIQMKLEEQKRSRWSNPLVIAVLAAALAGAGNAVVAWINGRNQLELEESKDTIQQRIEESKAESARILEAVKATDPDQAADNLQFLLDTMLISNAMRRQHLIIYLRNRPGGQGVATQAFSPFGQNDSWIRNFSPNNQTATPDNTQQ
ncbi:MULTISPECIES: hypothetical protein [Methylobacterium]|uniref:hypothetical protein n=1 Tax=Methylobacterium TaxID=407 RepID=UPI001114F254|nr:MULTISPECIES: hypothetical protein [Methylobacterium]